MSVVLSVADAGTCRKQLTIEVPAAEVDTETRKVLAAYGKQASIPGFRKGKVPASVLRQRFGDEIQRDVVERLLPRYWNQAEKEQGLDSLGDPELVEVGDVTAGEPLRFVAAVDVRPDVDLGELDGFELPEVEVEPSDEEVDASLDELRRQVGEWKAAGRPAARGDRVRVRLFEAGASAGEATAEGAEDENGEGEDGETQEAAESVEPTEPDEGDADAATDEEAAAEAEEGQVVHVEVGDPRVWEELSLAVTGLEAGQDGRFTRRPPEGSEGEPRTFKLTIEEVEERELPPLDDELAARLGEFENVDELREAVAGRLRHERESERATKRREALMTQLRQRHPLPLPDGVVQAEVRSLLESYAQDLARRGIDPNEAGLDWAKVAEEAKPSAEQRVHDRLLLDAVVTRDEIAVPGDEVEATIAAFGRARGESAAQVRQNMGPAGVASLERQLAREKALRALLGEEPAADDEAEAEDGAEAAGDDSEE